MTFLPSIIPLIQAPMAGAQGPELAIAVCRAGGLGSLPAAMLTPDHLREQIGAVRRETNAPYNVNFFCHAEPAPNPETEARWRNRLAPYYAEAGIDPSGVAAAPARAPFGEAMCAVVRRDAAGRRELSFRLAARPTAFARQNRGRADPCVRHDRRRGALARATWSRRRHCAGPGGWRAPRHVPFRRHRRPTRPDFAPAASARRGALAGRGGRRHQRWARNRGGLCARRGCGPDRHRLFAHAGGDDLPDPSRGARERQRRRNAVDERVHRAAGARAHQSLRVRSRTDVPRTRRTFPWRRERRRRCGLRTKSAAAAISRPSGPASPQRSRERRAPRR